MSGENKWSDAQAWAQMIGREPMSGVLTVSSNGVNSLSDINAEFGVGVVGDLATHSQGLRKDLDYQREQMRKTTELLIEKDQQAQFARLERDAMRRERDQLKVEVRVYSDMVASRREELKAYQRLMAPALDLCIPIVRDLFASTNSAKEHAACKAALAAYEETAHALATRDPAPDPRPVDHAPVGHLSDCQAERPAGVAGGQLPGPAGRREDGAGGRGKGSRNNLKGSEVFDAVQRWGNKRNR